MNYNFNFKMNYILIIIVCGSENSLEKQCTSMFEFLFKNNL